MKSIEHLFYKIEEGDDDETIEKKAIYNSLITTNSEMLELEEERERARLFPPICPANVWKSWEADSLLTDRERINEHIIKKAEEEILLTSENETESENEDEDPSEQSTSTKVNKEDTRVSVDSLKKERNPVPLPGPLFLGGVDKNSASMNVPTELEDKKLTEKTKQEIPKNSKQKIKRIYPKLSKMKHDTGCLCPVCMKNTRRRNTGAIPKRKLVFEANFAGTSVDSRTGRPTPNITLKVCLRDENNEYKKLRSELCLILVPALPVSLKSLSNRTI